ncbi:DUF1461 domain-containing protein [Thiomicrorhabdus sp. 6S2-11]|uniref:DUF1461 domain-containing protein n=1 Tax=Thiomicrorhabdus marina TaxID=2818442 RepID=A0ABS3Q2E5_9GAMM|nr:DUF1461 domain-containing protein [Thiomicrorhabdus marina]MBO1926495.1 DUF1461 domain-containing protein [Thiomicrorhabdus marina]
MKTSTTLSLSLYRFIWVWLTLTLCLWLGWHLLAQFNFLYPLWHDYASIGANIDHYSPLNKFRHEFALTDRETRFAMFAGIVEAIHQHGQGLQDLTYPTSKGMVPLLRSPEIIHLQDVANLIDLLNKLALWLWAVWLVVSYLIVTHSKTTFINTKNSLLNLIIGLGVAIAVVLIIGAKKVFYQMHIWIFPDDHQWFFYYQESLMSTMMKAPDLFAWIAASLLLTALILYLAVHWIMNYFTKQAQHE